MIWKQISLSHDEDVV